MSTYSSSRNLESARTEWRHAKAKYVLYDAFTRGNVNHPYRYIASELGVKEDGSPYGSWDIVLANIDDLRRGYLTPIFVEVKTRFNDNEHLVADLIKKIDETEELISSGNLSFLINQISQTVSGQLTFSKDIEYALFIPSQNSTSLIDYIRRYAKKTDFAIGIVLWVLDNTEFDGDTISIPYLTSNGTKICRNVRKSNSPIHEINICLCKHNNESLNRWFQSGRAQGIQIGGTLPPRLRRYWTNPASAITVILTSGKVIHSHETYITKEDLFKRIKELYDSYKVPSEEDDIRSYVSLMEVLGIVKVAKDIPLKPLQVNKGILKLLRDGDSLLDEIVKRTSKKKIDASFGYFDN